MKQVVSAVFAPLCALCLAASMAVEENKYDGQGADEVDLARSVELGNNILASFRDEDFVHLRRNIPGPLQSKMTENDFRTSCRNCRDTLGEIRAYEYAFELDTPAVRNLIWRVGFEREDSEGEPVEQDMLFRLVTGTVDGEVKVLSCGFL